jgi:hypothetical protein
MFAIRYIYLVFSLHFLLFWFCDVTVHVREYRRKANQKWTFQRDWQHLVHKTTKNKAKTQHNKNKNHTFNWLNTLHVTFTIPRYRLECWYRPVQKPCIDWYYWFIHGYLFVYVLITYNVSLKWPRVKQMSSLVIYTRKVTYLYNSCWYGGQYQDIQISQEQTVYPHYKLNTIQTIVVVNLN